MISLCLALVSLIAFGGLGVWLQLPGARARHPDEAVEGVRLAEREWLLTATCVVAAFSVLVQGTAVRSLVRRSPRPGPENNSPGARQAPGDPP